jgi:hypothetical protein
MSLVKIERGMVEIRNIIAAINPDIYCDESVKSEVKSILADSKDKDLVDAVLKAAEKAKFVSQDELFNVDEIKYMNNPFKTPGLNSPSQYHKLIYDSPTDSLEPIYFYILDFMNNLFGGKVTKLTDNFISSPGSAHFSELGQKATKMQEEAMKTLGAVNQVLKSILNIIYDLKEFNLRLELYDRYKNAEDKNEKNAAFLSLKQVWLDNVDIKRANSSIKAMAQQFDFVTLIDAFMAAKTLEDVTLSPEEGGLDLNERVKRIIQQRIAEFTKWLAESEKELRKRYEIERQYLKSQYNSIQLYARWVAPYLKAARQLEQNLTPQAALVTTFNTVILEMNLLGESVYDVRDDIVSGVLPEFMKTATKRKYSRVALVEFRFRGIPQRVGQGYSYGGRTEIVFTSYGLRDDELDLLKKAVEKSNFGDVMQLIEGSTTESLALIKEDIDFFLDDDKQKSGEKEKKSNNDDLNPFTALFSFLKKPEEKKDKGKDKKANEKKFAPDTTYEKVIRSQAIIAARDTCFTLYDIYKKAHQMLSI